MLFHRLYIRLLFFVVIQISINHGLRSQLIELPNIELISQKDGLPFNSSNCLIQDKRGFIWMGGVEGLARYDGYSFVTIQHDPSIPNSLPNNKIIALERDHDGMIWVGHLGGYVSRIDPITFNIWHTKIDSAEETSVYKIFCDSKGVIWCSVPTLGLYKFYGKSFHFVCKLGDLPQKSGAPPAAFNSISTFLEDDNYTFWLGSSNGLYKFNPGDSSLKHVSSLGEVNKPAVVTQLVSFDKDGVWCATYGEGLIYYDIKKNSYQKYLFQQGYPGTNNLVARAIKKSENEIWVATTGCGIGLFKTNTKKFSFFLENGKLGSGPMCLEMIVDRSRIIWALSDRGLLKWDPDENYFMFNKVPVTRSDNYDYYGITKILNDKKNDRMIIGTNYADGVHIIDRNGKEKILAFPIHPLAESYLTINDLRQDKQGNVYMVTRDFIFLITPDNQLKKIDAINTLLPASTVPYFYTMLQSEDGDLWVTSSRNGLFHMDSKNNTWERIIVDSPFALTTNKLWVNLEDKNHQIWLMHSRAGISVYNPATRKWTKYKHEAGKPTSLVSNQLTDMTITPQGEIFISSLDGISKFDSKNNSFINQNISTGLPIYSLASDNEGMLWASSNKGILKIDPATWQFQIFHQKDGIQGGYFTVQNDNGKMYLRTFQGFYSFNPSEIKNYEERISPVLITSIQNLNTKKIDYNLHDKFYVDYRNNSFSIEFASLNFFSPLKKNKYRYKMAGLDDEWIESYDHIVNYSSVPSGSYIFQVQLLGDNINSSLGTIKIIVSTPFWKQDWFRILVFTIGLGTTYHIYRLRLKQVRKDEKIKSDYNKKLAEVEMKALKAQMNPHFIFNSLNSINRYIVKSEPEKASLYLTKFSKLIRLILDNSNQKIISLEDEINSLKLYIELEAFRFNEKFEFAIHISNQLDCSSIGIPPMIIQPFVENAIWHGLLHKEELGKLEVLIEQHDNRLKCTIADNGIGRKKAAELKSKSVNREKSYGMKITNDRLTMLNGKSQNLTIEIIDLEDSQGNALGTKVIVNILLMKLESEF